MERASPFKPIALVVEDDAMQRELAAILLEDCEMGVVQCASAEAAMQVLVRLGPSVSMMLTDVNLAGKIDGVELAQFTHEAVHP
jgi:CheY-like chemotaxis protein